MKLEHRAILAFVVSMLLFLGYDALYLSPKLEKERKQRATELLEQRRLAGDTVLVSTPAAPETASKAATPAEQDEQTGLVSSAAADTSLAGFAGEPPVTFVVASPLYEVAISATGGEIASARLLQYTAANEPVELLADDSEWGRGRAMSISLDGESSGFSVAGVSFSAFLAGSGQPLADGARIEVRQGDLPTEVILRASRNGNGTIERYYRFYVDRYDFEAGIRFGADMFPAVENVTWGMGAGLRSTETNRKDDLQSLRAIVQLGAETHTLTPSTFSRKDREEYSGTLTWSSLQTKYFMAAMIPPEPTRATVAVVGSKQNHLISGQITLPAIARQGRVESAIRVYMGPLDYDILKSLGVGLDKNIQMGWRLIRPVSWAVLWSVKWMYQYIPNYGVVIVLISILTKVLFFRLTNKSFKSMKDLQELQPKMQALKEKFKDDRQRLSQETMKLYKEAGVNPFGGCLPLVLQMPVFIALFNVLKYTIQLRGAPFFGWITDLSQQDVLFKFPISLPFIGNSFSLLPILMGVAMLLQTKIGGSITGSPGSQATPKSMNTILPIVFTFLFYSMPSGLVLYWLVNTVLSIGQQYYIQKNSPKKTEVANEKTQPEVAPKRRAKMKKER
jgi:YidC/Oxa1 family membrane protein insertase